MKNNDLELVAAKSMSAFAKSLPLSYKEMDYTPIIFNIIINYNIID
jgi:hypothetical protein